MNFPWKDLSSKPVEILFKDIFLIVSPKNRHKWNLEDLYTFKKKIEKIDEHVKKLIEESLKKAT